MPSISSFSINDQLTGGVARELKPGERQSLQQDGKDQILVRSQGKDYLIEGESLKLDGLKEGKLPQAQIKIDGVSQSAQISHIDNEAQGFGENLRQTFSLPAGWGKASQIAGTLDELADLQGNRDGLWNNETEKAGNTGSLLSRNPLALKGREHLSGKFDTQAQIAELTRYRLQQEEQWGQPVTSLDVTQLKEGELFAVQKTLTLARMERTPAEVSEGFVKAAGKVNGHTIAPRELFWQRFKPVGQPSGKVVVMFPGFLQTGRNFNEQVALLNKQGHDVLVMDQQWAGQTRGGKEGGVDRGYGITRDVAAMTAYAQEVLEAGYASHPDKELILMGTSLGGGPGVIGALTMNANGKLELEGPQMPQKLKVILQGPFLGATESLNNKVFDTASKIPLANQLPLPAIGLPMLTTDPEAAQKIAQGAVMEDLSARLQAMTAVNQDVEEILKLIEAGKGPRVPIEIIHSKGDPLASAAKTQWLAEHLPSARLSLLESSNHVLEQQAQEQQEALKALQRLNP